MLIFDSRCLIVVPVRQLVASEVIRQPETLWLAVTSSLEMDLRYSFTEGTLSTFADFFRRQVLLMCRN
jgi:hypothetical protein